MSKTGSRWAESIMEGLVAVLGVAATVTVIRALPMLWTEEAAGWAQAIGSVAAIGVAIRIAHNDTVKRVEELENQERKEMAIARFTAASIELLLIHLIEATRQAKSQLDLRFTGHFVATFYEIGDELGSAGHISEERLLRLIPFPNECASAITLAQDRIISTTKNLLRSTLDRNQTSTAEHSQFASDNSDILANALRQLEDAFTTIKAEIAHLGRR